MARAHVVATVLVASGIAPVDRSGIAHAESRRSNAEFTEPVDGPAVEPSQAPRDISAARRLAAIGASLVPGALLHGSGSYVLGEKRTAKKLAITGGIGLGAMAIGGAAVGISGAAPEMVDWGVPLIIAGTALFIPTWFADIWTAAGGRKVLSFPHAPAPWALEVGTTYLHDAYRERGFVRTAGRIDLGRIGFGASTLVDVEGQARTGDLEARVRLLGVPATGETRLRDASRLWIRAAVRRHEDDDDLVEISTIEADVGTRVELRKLDRVLAGAFIDLAIGMGIERVRFADLATDDDTLFLGRFGWGVFLGELSEATVFYDHRRDSLAGGIAASRAAGFVGSVGGNFDLSLGGPFAVVGELEIGNGWVTTLGIRYSGGPR